MIKQHVSIFLSTVNANVWTGHVSLLIDYRIIMQRNVNSRMKIKKICIGDTKRLNLIIFSYNMLSMSIFFSTRNSKKIKFNDFDLIKTIRQNSNGFKGLGTTLVKNVQLQPR